MKGSTEKPKEILVLQMKNLRLHLSFRIVQMSSNLHPDMTFNGLLYGKQLKDSLFIPDFATKQRKCSFFNLIIGMKATPLKLYSLTSSLENKLYVFSTEINMHLFSNVGTSHHRSKCYSEYITPPARQ